MTDEHVFFPGYYSNPGFDPDGLKLLLERKELQQRAAHFRSVEARYLRRKYSAQVRTGWVSIVEGLSLAIVGAKELFGGVKGIASQWLNS